MSGRKMLLFAAFSFRLSRLGCLVSCFYLTFGNSNTICFNTPFPSYGNLEQTAIFAFPPSASHIEFSTNAFNRKGGCTIWLQFEMAASDFDTLKASTLVEELTNVRLAGSPFERFSERMSWSQPLNSIAGHGFSGDGIYTEQWIFIDINDPNRWVVYLITNMEWT
jgi:hypothetical protein